MSDKRGDEWYSPKWLIEALGEFDTDPAAPSENHWTAKTCFTKKQNGLAQDWLGRVYMNPPFTKISPWIFRMREHGNGIAHVFARMDTQWMDHALCGADGICFLTGRISFVDITGQTAKPATAPSILLAYGKENVEAIARALAEGKFAGRLFSETIPHDYLELDHATPNTLENPTEQEIDQWAIEAEELAKQDPYIKWRSKEAQRLSQI